MRRLRPRRCEIVPAKLIRDSARAAATRAGMTGRDGGRMGGHLPGVRSPHPALCATFAPREKAFLN